MKRLPLFIVLIVFAALGAHAQDIKAKFGKISPEDFAPHVYAVDSNASAVVIADIGSTQMEGNENGNFSLDFKHYRRVHILNKNGYDIANVTIPIYTNGNMEEDLYSLKAVTYNLENGKVVETKLDTKAQVFKDRINSHLVVKKFTFPNIKEGSIIEYEYKLKSDFIFNLQPWEFQGGYPRLWSEYTVTLPEFYYYVTLSQGYQPFYIKDQKSSSDNFTITEDAHTAESTKRTTISAGVTAFHWAMKDVPALKEESFTSTLDNHIAKIEFQLSELRYPFTPKNIMGTWTDLCDELLKDDQFGGTFNRDNGWLSDIMPDAIQNASNDLDKARNIYAYVRDHFTCTNHHRKYAEQSLKSVVKTHSGNVGEINMLLLAMLRKAHLTADPVLLSTRDNGYAYSLYPLVDRFNYVICQLNIANTYYYLDASEPHLGFGRLGYECYNGHARVINQQATPLEFVSDSLLERKVTTIFIAEDEKGGMQGSLSQTPGYYESSDLRDRIKDKGQTALFADIKKNFGSEIEIHNPVVDSLTKYEEPVGIKYDFDLNLGNEDIIYFSPMFGEGYKENPFKSAERNYPIEMPYAIDEVYLLQIPVPKGYKVDELPRQTLVKLNENDDGFFEYRIQESEGFISLRSRLYLKRAYYGPEEYETLRQFFNLVVKKHNEQIVFKKIK